MFHISISVHFLPHREHQRVFMTFREIAAVFCKKRMIYGASRDQRGVTRTDVTTWKQPRRNQIFITPKGFQAYRMITLPSLRVLTFPSHIVHYAHCQKELAVSCPFGWRPLVFLCVTSCGSSTLGNPRTFSFQLPVTHVCKQWYISVKLSQYLDTELSRCMSQGSEAPHILKLDSP